MSSLMFSFKFVSGVRSNRQKRNRSLERHENQTGQYVGAGGKFYSQKVLVQYIELRKVMDTLC